MRAFPILCGVAALLACDTVRDRGDCGQSTDCRAGEYCARTPNGNVCWPDAVPPTVSGVTVTCASPCLRDGVLHVEATVSDDREVLGAEVTLDLGGPAVAMARAGAVWKADVPLRQFPFDAFARGVVATVTARDGARNETLEPSAATTVTRLRWRQALAGGGLAPPAVSQTGVIAVPASTGRVYFVGWDGAFLGSVDPALNTPQVITAPTAVGDSFWVGAEDGNIYELSTGGGTWSATSRANTGGAVRGSLATTSSRTIIATSESGVVYAVTSAAARNGPMRDPFTIGPVVDQGDGIFAVAAGSASRFTLVFGFPTDAWGGSTAIGGTVADPLACATALVAVANTGTVGLAQEIAPNGDPEHVATTAIPSGGTAILPDGSIIVPEQTKTVSRWTNTGAVFPGWQKPDLGGATRTPLVVTGTEPFLVPTAKGALHALHSDGTIAWSGQLSAGTASLQPGNIYTPPTEPAGAELSTAYFAGSDGVLHAVIVDGKLDGSAPWPKAFHDPQNTNRAGPQP